MSINLININKLNISNYDLIINGLDSNSFYIHINDVYNIGTIFREKIITNLNLNKDIAFDIKIYSKDKPQYIIQSFLENNIISVFEKISELKVSKVLIPLLFEKNEDLESSLNYTIDLIDSYLNNSNINFFIIIPDVKSNKYKIVNDFIKNSLYNIHKDMVFADYIFPLKLPHKNLIDISSPMSTFSETLLNLIDEAGYSDTEVYKKANIDRKLFSKIRSNKDYQPHKNTAIAFAIALELDYCDTNDLLATAGYTLSDSKIFDLIIKYAIENKIYNIHEVNLMLYEFNQKILI